ncbi:MAG: hypothetical protein OQL06_08360 [Gammaproteobacteria bacterium]|nr:hypothetical protein [Gammaproteobacteria bacterium]
MNNYYKIGSSIILALFSHLLFASSITDTYSTGDTLTTTTLNNIKSAVNDNDTNITTNSADISTNAADISDLQTNTSEVFLKTFDSSIHFQIPVLSSTAANTTVYVWLSNHSSTSCYAYLASSTNTWNVGSNSKSTLLIIPFYSQTYMTGRTSSGTFPNIIYTYTIVQRSAMNTDVSTEDYVDVSFYRNEASTSDTCNAGNIYVRGAIATYPGGTQYFVPVTDMVVN